MHFVPVHFHLALGQHHGWQITALSLCVAVSITPGGIGTHLSWSSCVSSGNIGIRSNESCFLSFQIIVSDSILTPEIQKQYCSEKGGTSPKMVPSEIVSMFNVESTLDLKGVTGLLDSSLTEKNTSRESRGTAGLFPRKGPGAPRRAASAEARRTDILCSDTHVKGDSCVLLCRVASCPVGLFSPPTCDSQCRCVDPRYCDVLSGACAHSECPAETFGPPLCHGVCQCRFDVECDRHTGACPFGCKAGWEGITCGKRVCPSGFYSPPKCDMTCHCTEQNHCDAITGACSLGCAKGWQGPACSEQKPKCQLGTANCALESMEECDCSDPECRQFPSECKTREKKPCPKGWEGPFCDQRVCPKDFYGPPLCLSPCGCADARHCDAYDGNCQKGPCRPGLYGHSCSEVIACEAKRFGYPRCDQTCYCTNDSACDPIFGNCSFGCKPGWAGKHCNQRMCKDGFYRFPYCDLKCRCSDQRECNSKTGGCENSVCPDGWGSWDCNIREQLNIKKSKTSSSSWEIIAPIIFLASGSAVAVYVFVSAQKNSMRAAQLVQATRSRSRRNALQSSTNDEEQAKAQHRAAMDAPEEYRDSDETETNLHCGTMV